MDQTGPFLSPCFLPSQEIWNIGRSSVWSGPEKKWSSMWSGPERSGPVRGLVQLQIGQL